MYNAIPKQTLLIWIKFSSCIIINLLIVSCSKDYDILEATVLNTNNTDLEISELDSIETKTVSFVPIYNSYITHDSIINTESPKNSGYLIYDLSAIKGQITDAYIELTMPNTTSTGKINIAKGVSIDWYETTLDTLSAPKIDNQKMTTDFILPINGKLNVDLNSLELDTEAFTLIMSSDNGNIIELNSKEISENPPILIITFIGDYDDSYQSNINIQNAPIAVNDEIVIKVEDDKEYAENNTNNEGLDDGFDIILVAGQSNTHGGKGYDQILDSSDDFINQLGRFNDMNLKIIKAEEPLDHHTKTEGKIGFALTFAKLYKQEFGKGNRPILIIPCGKNSTGFKQGDWNKGDELYEDVVTRVKFVLENFPNSSLKTILWHQGENDVNNNDFENTLDKFIVDIRKDLNAPDVPLILGGMVPYWVTQKPERIALQQVLLESPARLNNVAYANPSLPVVINKVDEDIDYIHFDAQGQRELGRRYFEEYFKLR